MILVTVLMDFQSHGFSCFKGEQRKLSRECAEVACGAGWAKSDDPSIKNGEVSFAPKVLQVDNLQIGQAADAPGVK